MENTSIPCVSFIGIVDFSQEARWLYMTPTVSDLLGWEPHELRGRPSLELVHPDEMARVRKLHYDTIRQDKAACLVYLRMKHKNPYKGYVLCAVSRTIVHNVTVGSVSYANSSSKVLHNASTAQEITVISPTPELEFRRWHDPSPMPPHPISSNIKRSIRDLNIHLDGEDSSSEEDNQDFSYDPLPSQSFRTALILNRFSDHCPIMYCSNDLLITATSVEGRPFFDFVSKGYENKVKAWMDTVKTWGVNHRGQPSDGGFGFCKFTLLRDGRDYLAAQSAEPAPARQRRESSHSHPSSSHTRSGRSARANVRGSVALSPRSAAKAAKIPEDETLVVDSIMSAHSDGIIVILRRAAV